MRFRVATCGQLDVPVRVGQRLLPNRPWKFRQGDGAAPVAHWVNRVKLYGAGGILDALLWLGCGRDSVGVSPASRLTTLGR